MKKFYMVRLISLILTLILVTISCRKQELPEQPILVGFDKLLISDWLDQHNKDLSKIERVNLEIVTLNLDYSHAEILPRYNGDKLVVIPLNDDVKRHLKLDDRSSVKLMIVQNKSGKLRWSTIVAYSPLRSNTLTDLSSTTLQQILNVQPVTVDGQYKFFSALGRLLYQITYEGGKVRSLGRVVQVSSLPKNAKKILPRPHVNNLNSSSCIDWYLITTVYDQFGNVIDSWEEYIATTCYEGEGGGGGPGGEPYPEEPNDQEVEIDHIEHVIETNYVDEDYTLSDPNSLNSTAYASPIEYEFPVHITYIVIPLLITKITLDDVRVYPVSETTIHPTKGTFHRYIMASTTNKTGYPIGVAAYCAWGYELRIQYTNVTEGLSYSRILRNSHTSYVTVP